MKRIFQNLQMTKQANPQQTPTPIRLPDDLKLALKGQAEQNNRSMNGEILNRLRATFASAKSVTAVTHQPCSADPPNSTAHKKDEAVFASTNTASMKTPAITTKQRTSHDER